jgi:predicted HicB family RNase H-like nuclease
MNTMTYKGYTASVWFDDRDNIFVGRVLGVRDIIGFHGEAVADLTRDFHNAIDFFLEDCKERGIAPEKPASGKLMLRIPPEVHGAALVAAQAAGTSLNQWAAKALAEAAHAG